MPTPASVGIDIGGTKLVAATLDGDGAPLERARVVTPATGTADELVRVLVDLVRQLGEGLPVGVGIAGIVDRDGVLRYGPNVAVRDLPLQARLADELGVDVLVRNDASVALYGEWARGAGRGVHDLVMLTLGTGVGGGVMLGGALVEGAHGLGGELGHIIVHDGGRRCPCGNLGCLEAYASGTAIARQATERLAEDPGDSVLAGRGTTLTGKDVTEAALAGDALAREVLEEAGRVLGVGVASLANALDPGRVVIGGGAGINAAEIILPVAREAARQRLMGRAHRPPLEVVLARLGDDAGMIGAGLLVRAGT